MKRRYKRAIGVLIAVAVGSAYWWLPHAVFDTSEPALDTFEDYRNGKPVAWGPRPRYPRNLIRPRQWWPTFEGNEWQFMLFRDYCNGWLERNGYATPSN